MEKETNHSPAFDTPTQAPAPATLGPEWHTLAPVVAVAPAPVAQALAEAPAAFPLHVLPQACQTYIAQLAEAQRLPKDYTAAAMLAALSVCIGNTHRVQVGYTQPASLFLCVIGPSGSRKSPAFSAALEPLFAYDKQKHQELKAALELYEAYASLPKQEQAQQEPVSKPRDQRPIVQQCTIEKLAYRLQDNTRGLLQYSDEINGWLEGFTRYNKGGEAEQWLELYEGTPKSIDRVKNPIPIYVPRPFISVLGGIQPGIFSRFMAGGRLDSGFIQRFLFVNSRATPQARTFGDCTPLPGKEAYTQLCNRLLGLSQQPDGDDYKPREVTLSQEAKGLLMAYSQECVNLTHQYTGAEFMQSLILKYDNHVIRLALILHCACSLEQTGKVQAQISGQTAADAVTLCRYFLGQATETLQGAGQLHPMAHKGSAWVRWYNTLPDAFTTEQALAAGQSLGLAERTVKEALAKEGCIKKLAHGQYAK